MRYRKWVYQVIGWGSVLLLLVSACGTGTNDRRETTPPSIVATAVATATQVLQDVPTHQPATITPTSLPTKENVPPGSITIALDKSQYMADEKITVTITNGLGTSITTMDHQTSCTILALQIQKNGNWLDVQQARCQLMTPTREILIAAQSTLVQNLAPGSGTIHKTPWQAGQYRLCLRYTLDAPNKQRDTGTIYSPTFSIS